MAYKDPALPFNAIAQEIGRQIQKILATGLPVRHLDGHHHAICAPNFLPSSPP